MYSPLGGRRDMLAAAGDVSWYWTGMLMFEFQVLGFGGVPSRYLPAWGRYSGLAEALAPCFSCEPCRQWVMVGSCTGRLSSGSSIPQKCRLTLASPLLLSSTRAIAIFNSKATRVNTHPSYFVRRKSPGVNSFQQPAHHLRQDGPK